MINPTLAEQAVQFEELRFKNTEVERDARATFQRDLTNAVRVTEDAVLDEAIALSKEIAQHAKTVDAVRQELAELTVALVNDGPMDLERWAALDRRAQALESSIDRFRARADALQPRMEDPLRYASELQERFSGLHRPMLLPAPGTY